MPAERGARANPKAFFEDHHAIIEHFVLKG